MDDHQEIQPGFYFSGNPETADTRLVGWTSSAVFCMLFLLLQQRVKMRHFQTRALF
jgi:hypothetical protein